MFVVHLLMQCLCAADHAEEIAMQQEPNDEQLCTDMRQNRAAIRDAQAMRQPFVLLPCAMPDIKQIYSNEELQEFLDREKKAQQPKNNDVMIQNMESYDEAECAICLESFFKDDTKWKNSFAEGVYKTHNRRIMCMMCPNPKCRAKICYRCAYRWIRDKSGYDPVKIPFKHYDIKGKQLSDELMVLCPYCFNYLNVKLSQLDTIPKISDLAEDSNILRI
ncbi:hypothetical protein ENBRE01_2013 [Enteropsectra breve]|nr:hypothetical protein ENBRE01_2013 [Enteropsectra breve]